MREREKGVKREQVSRVQGLKREQVSKVHTDKARWDAMRSSEASGETEPMTLDFGFAAS